jgi:site-specific DNA recombinase
LSDNIEWGIRRKYESGSMKSVPCGKFLGYDKIDGKLVINEEQATIVHRIYREFLDGYSVSQIASHLTTDGIPSEQGNIVWNLSSVKQILTNEKYTGDTLFKKTYNTVHLTKKRADNKGELPQY